MRRQPYVADASTRSGLREQQQPRSSAMSDAIERATTAVASPCSVESSPAPVPFSSVVVGILPTRLGATSHDTGGIRSTIFLRKPSHRKRDTRVVGNPLVHACLIALIPRSRRLRRIGRQDDRPEMPWGSVPRVNIRIYRVRRRLGPGLPGPPTGPSEESLWIHIGCLHIPAESAHGFRFKVIADSD
jgi:hypothetical protein